MAVFNSLLERLGPAIVAYERRGNQAPDLLDGECDDFSAQTDDKSNNGSPSIDLELVADECNEPHNLPEGKKFLWIIDEYEEKLRLRIIPEQTENKNRAHKPIVCHTNITGCNKALQGGECWWCEETKTMFINPKSGRYGAETVDQWNAVKEFFQQIGYIKLTDSIPAEWALKQK